MHGKRFKTEFKKAMEKEKVVRDAENECALSASFKVMQRGIAEVDRVT